jgi:D-alanyl-D-alanine-carboxypeptidase/D-alanyl-D-alanine-endopeptidase
VTRALLLATLIIAGLCNALATHHSRLLSQRSAEDIAEFTISNDEIQRILEDRIALMHKGVGLVVGLVDRTGTRVVSYGTTDRKNNQRVNGDSVFEIGSITKMFTTLLLADMVGRGEVHLDDPISKYLPDSVKVPTRNGREITLLHLATHTSGLPREPDNFAPLWWRLCFFCPGGDGTYYSRYSVEQMYAFLSNYKLKRDIGAESEYSNYAVALLGQILARRAGMDYVTLVRTRITQPLGMTDTVLRPTPEMQTRLTAGHHESLKFAADWPFSDTLAGAGGLRSTTNDLLKFAAANLGLSPSPLLAAMQRSHERTDTPKGDIGLGWNIANPFDADIRQHGGSSLGYRSFLGMDLKRRRGVVVLSNTRHDIEDIGMHLLESRLPLFKDRKSIKVKRKILDAYVGDYQLTRNREVTLRRRGDRLFGQVTDQEEVELFGETETEFFLKVANVQFAFVKNSAGRVTHVIIHQDGLDQTVPKIK